MFLLGYKARGIKTSFNGEGEIGISKVIYIWGTFYKYILIKTMNRTQLNLYS